MPFKSQAQRRKFAQLLVEGKISNETFEEWNRETGAKRLPERARRKTKSAKKSTAKKSTAKRTRSRTSAKGRNR
jgi:trimethylamine:corrinoid methyltransferase-like protein